MYIISQLAAGILKLSHVITLQGVQTSDSLTSG